MVVVEPWCQVRPGGSGDLDGGTMVPSRPGGSGDLDGNKGMPITNLHQALDLPTLDFTESIRGTCD
jgi:hypothetical protein